MSEGTLNNYRSTTSLSVVWTTKEVEDKNNNNNQHQYSRRRRRQFFTISFSVLSPFLTPSPHQLYLWATGWVDCVSELEGKEIVFRLRDGTEFTAFYAKDGQKKGSRGNFIDELTKKLENHYPGVVAVNNLARIDVDFLKETFWKIKVKQYRKVVDLAKDDGKLVNEALNKSSFDHPNLVLPHLFVLNDPSKDVKTRKPFRSLRSITLCGGVGRLKEVFDFLSDKSPELREVILSQAIKGALEGLEHIHSKGFVYGHFDPSNIIVCEDKTTGKLTGKLIGFANCCQAKTRCPTPGCHLAPECRQSSEHTFDPSMDLWELGSCLFFLLTRQPYRDSSKAKNPLVATQLVGQGLSEWTERDERLLKNAKFAPLLKSLIQKLLATGPQQRPNISQVLNSPWMKQCECLISQNPEYMDEISKIIKMFEHGVPKKCPTEFENLETQLHNETSYQSSGSLNSAGWDTSFESYSSEEAETSSELATVATTSVRDLDSVPVCSSDTLEHHGASAVNDLSTAATSNLETAKMKAV